MTTPDIAVSRQTLTVRADIHGQRALGQCVNDTIQKTAGCEEMSQEDFADKLGYHRT